MKKKFVKKEEALLNEYKGNLFEFLMGKEISHHYKRETSYLDRIPQGFVEKLIHYEDYIRQHDGELLNALPLMARKSFDVLKDALPAGSREVFLVGKLVGGSNNKELGEADLLLKEGAELLSLGIKLCRKGSFVNTKSGGVRSFFTRYFASFDKASFFQERVNRALESAFEEMGQKLYEINGLHFQGSIDESWTAKGKSSLPGELGPQEREVVLEFYYRAVREFHEAFVYFLKEDRECFCRGLLALLGFSCEGMIQMTTFYDRTSFEKYIYSETKVEYERNLVGKMKTLAILPLKEKRSSFEIVFSPHRLQIRLKPMNVFTVPGLKVNCSRKFISSL